MFTHLLVSFFFFNDTATTEIYTLSLHDALPITTPSKTWMRSLSPSLIFVWTRTESPARISGTSLRTYFAWMSAIALRSMTLSLLLQLVVSGIDEPEVALREVEPREEVRPPLACGAQRLAPPPPLDSPVVSREEDLRNLHPPELGGPCVVRVLEEPVLAREALCAGGRLVPEHARDEPRGRVRDAERRELAARHDEVSDRDLHVHRRHHALVHSFVPTAHEDQPALPGEAARQRLVEPHAPWARQDRRRAREPSPRRLDGVDERLGLHHHPGTAAVRGVIRDVVLARSVIADVGHPHREQPALARLPEDALGEVALAHPREQRQDLDLQLHVLVSSRPPSCIRSP